MLHRLWDIALPELTFDPSHLKDGAKLDFALIVLKIGQKTSLLNRNHAGTYLCMYVYMYVC